MSWGIGNHVPAEAGQQGDNARTDSAPRGAGLRFAARAAVMAGIGLLLANCASQPERRGAHHGSREIGAFADPKYGKVGLDETAPKGGGRYQVGRPYSVAGKRYVPREKPTGYRVTGMASWYGVAFHGRKTANGEIYDRNMISAAHPTMPLPSYARVTNLRNNHSIIVRVNDRGPYDGGRVLDVSERTAQLLQFKHLGTAKVKVEYLGQASLNGSDDRKLVASLRNGNGPAPFSGPASTMVAAADPTPAPQPPVRTALAFSAVPNPSEAVSTPADAPAPSAIGLRLFGAPAAAPVQAAAVPLDLETIGGAATPVVPGSLATGGPIRAAGSRPAGAPMALPSASPTALSFGPDTGLRTRFEPNHPLAQVFGRLR